MRIVTFKKTVQKFIKYFYCYHLKLVIELDGDI